MNINSILFQFYSIINISVDKKKLTIYGEHKDSEVECETITFKTKTDAILVKNRIMDNLAEVNRNLRNNYAYR